MPTTTFVRAGGWMSVALMTMGGAVGVALAGDATPAPPPDEAPFWTPVREMPVPAPDEWSPPMFWCTGCEDSLVWPNGGGEKIAGGNGLDHCAGVGCTDLLQPPMSPPWTPNPGGGELDCSGMGCGDLFDLTPPGPPPGQPDACMGLNCGTPPNPPPRGGGQSGEVHCLGLDCGTPQPGPPSSPPPSTSDPVPPAYCDGASGAGPGAPGFTPNPVDLAYGYKVEASADLTLPLTGRDFVLTRTYSGYRTTIGAGALGEAGAGWALNVTQMLTMLPLGCGEMVFGLTTPAGTVSYFFGGPEVWTSTGATDQTIVTGTPITIDGVTFETFEVRTPGRWTTWYSRDNVDGVVGGGRVLRIEDVYGHRRDFHWVQNDLVRISLADASGAHFADVRFTWGAAGSPAAGRLVEAEIRRVDDPAPLQRMTYHYFDASIHHETVGSPGDLVQTTSFVRVDRGPDGVGSPDEPVFYTRITQYRYHAYYTGDAGDHDTDGDGVYGEHGPDHALKMVIAPAQLEAAAHAAGTPLEIHAAELLARPDAGDADGSSGDLRVADLAGKVVTRYTIPERTVEEQLLRSSCGCGGGGGQMRLTYAFEEVGPNNGDFDDYRVGEVVASYGAGDQWTPYRTIRYDSRLRFVETSCNGQTIGLPIYQLENVAISTDADETSWWVTHFDYQRPGFAIQDPYPHAVHTPAACAQYTPAGGGLEPPVYVPRADRGLIRRYAYQNDRLTEVAVQSGAAGDPVLVRRYVWGAGTPVREHLLGRIDHIWDESAGETGRQTTTYDYGFYEGDAIRWIEAGHEADLPGENGPGGVFHTHTLYDHAGRPDWMRGPDGALVHRVFDPCSGAVTQETYNAPPTPELVARAVGLSGDWDGRYPDGGSLTYSRTYDELGRETTRTSPGGVTRHTVRELRENPLDSGLPFFAVVQLPPLNAGTPAAPASITWANAGGQPLRVSDFALAPDAASEYAVLRAFPYRIGGEVARLTHKRNLAGQLISEKQWMRLIEDGYVETVYGYDDLGRLETITAFHLERDLDSDMSERTVTRYARDTADRVVRVEIGTDPDAVDNMRTVATYVYDEGGVGNGLVTEARLETGDGSGPRTTRAIYDGRDRLRKVIHDLPPHSYFEYDDLDRVISIASCVELVDGQAAPSAADRLAYREYGYGQRGGVYREAHAIDPTSPAPAFLETHVWRDEMARVVGLWGPNAAASKATYDGLGRLVAAYVTDRAGDAAPGVPGGYADVYDNAARRANLSGDHVLEEHRSRHITDAAAQHVGMVDLVTRWQRVHDAPATTTGPLSELRGAEADHAIAIYAASYYDDLNRVIRSVAYGTNHPDGYVANGPAPIVDQSDPPDHKTSGAGVAFMTSAASFDDLGRLDHVTDVAGRRTKYFYDDAYRVIGVAENWTNGALLGWDPGTARWMFSGMNPESPDEDRITSSVLRADGANWKRIAHATGSDGQPADQMTEYKYGSTIGDASGSALNTGAALTAVRFPDGGEFLIGANRLGEVVRAKDPNGTVHVYTYDARGRMIEDAVAAFGPDVDDGIQRVTAAFDVAARRITVRSHAPTAVANAVTSEYDALGALSALYQNHRGDTLDAAGSPRPAVPTMTAAMATAPWDDGNHHRLTAVTYPNGDLLEYIYDPPGDRTGGSIGSTISRPQALRFAGEDLAGYDFLGVHTAVTVDYLVPDVQLDRSLAADGSRIIGCYPGYDGLGRIVRHAWTDGSLTSHAAIPGVPSRPPLAALIFSYDGAGNPASRRDGRPGAATALDQAYVHDNVNRLVEAQRGRWNNGLFEVGPGGRAWSLDTIGNWLASQTDVDGDGVFDPDETVEGQFTSTNALVQLESADGAFALTYDAVGNQTSKERPDGSRLEHVYDAWNRLVRVKRVLGASAATIGEYEYNGLLWRTVARSDRTPDDGVDVLDEECVFHYSMGWQVIEEHVSRYWPPGETGAVDRMVQNVWGLRHIDDLVLRRTSAAATPGWDDTLYALTDQSFSVTHLVDPEGVVAERVTYEPYGAARHHPFGDVDSDGDRDGIDRAIVYAIAATGVRPAIGGVDYRPEADLDRDGDVDEADVAIINGREPAVALRAGQLSSRGNIIGFCGYVHVASADLYLVRFRHLDATLGRWLQRDPAGYVDGSSLYEYVAGGPIFAVDPYGLCAQSAGASGPTNRRGRRVQGMPELRQGVIGINPRFGYAPDDFGIIMNHPRAVGGADYPLWTIILLSDDPHHIILDGLGLIPVIGEVADGVNAVVYLIEGRPGMAALSVAAMAPVVGGAAIAAKYGAKAGKAGRAMPPMFGRSGGDLPYGSFSITEYGWRGYPDGLARPSGPFRIVSGDEYRAAQNAKSRINGQIRRDHDLVGHPVDIHELHPIKFGGSPTDFANKTILDRIFHQRIVNPFWDSLRRTIEPFVAK